MPASLGNAETSFLNPIEFMFCHSSSQIDAMLFARGCLGFFQLARGFKHSAYCCRFKVQSGFPVVVNVFSKGRSILERIVRWDEF